MTALAFIGAGSMGSALIEGLLSAGRPAGSITASTGSHASASSLTERLGIRAMSLEADPDANRALAEEADIVVLGVKPWLIRETLTGLSPVLRQGQIVVSLAAGVMIEAMRPLAGPATVVRLMPNTPSAIGKGAAVVSAAPEADAAASRVQETFAPIGTVVRIPEEQIAAMTGIAGSGVAYFYYLAEALIEAGIADGLDPEVASRLVRATAEGAGAMLVRSDDDAAVLRRRVTSKGGTTAAAIAAFDEGGFPELVVRAAHAASQRSRDMADE